MEKYSYSEQELELIEKSCIPLAVYQFIDKRVVTIAVSEGFRKILNVDTLEEAYYLLDNDMYRDVHPDDIAEIANAAVGFATQGGEYNVLYRTRVAGEYIILHAIGKHIYTQTGERLAVVNYVNEGAYKEDIDSQSDKFDIFRNREPESRKELAKVSYDYLTGLPDMNYFFELAEACKQSALAKGRGVAMLFLDLSGMKAFNQRYGYAEGDLLIKSVARILVKHFSNDNCCRTTADHFAVYTYLDHFEEHLEELVEDLRKINEGKTLPVRIGMYDSGLEDVPVTTACDRAKIACDDLGYVFETSVRRFDVNMLKKFENRRYVFENIDRAIEEGWIKVYYQPIVRTSNGQVCDEEALARWHDPERGLMSPADFVPILEDAKIIYKLDLYVAEQVLKKLKEQAANGLYVVPNSINLSRTDFYACDMVEEIRRRVDESGVDRSRITIEITESVILDDIEFMMEQVNRFRKLGFSVWMDDFGSGYSSPDILQKIHFDVVKIDKLFVDQIETSEGSRVIITELVRLANGLGSETVAEGVETAAQAEFLKEIGCTRLQGYYYCKPIPLEQILERNNQGIQIGFENPEESAYYASLGNVNLYDVNFASVDEDENLSNYFNTMPMFIIEVGEDMIRFTRGNKSYREFMKQHFSSLYERISMTFNQADSVLGAEFSAAVWQCRIDGKRTVIDVKTSGGNVVHLFLRKVATNPVTNVSALAVVILGYVDNDAELRHREEMERIRQERQTYSRIAALSGNYICIYTVDPETDHFIQYTLNDSFKDMGLITEGEGFYERGIIDGYQVVYEEDFEMYKSVFTKENFLRGIERQGIFTLNYRLKIGGEIRYVCLRATMVEEEEGDRLIVGIVDTDEQVRRDQAVNQELTAARDIANLDTLTGVKNKHAYNDAVARLDSIIAQDEAPAFSIAVFDLNGLKEINDTRGHQAGDKFIKEACHIICHTFKHSPVFRIGGDEFAVISQGDDYTNIDSLMDRFAIENVKRKSEGGVVIAAGMSRYNGEKRTATVFKRADARMYANKKLLKGGTDE